MHYFPFPFSENEIESCGGKVCGKNAKCTQHGREKKCKCFSGFYGDGFTCTGKKDNKGNR